MLTAIIILSVVVFFLLVMVALLALHVTSQKEQWTATEKHLNNQLDKQREATLELYDNVDKRDKAYLDLFSEKKDLEVDYGKLCLEYVSMANTADEEIHNLRGLLVMALTQEHPSLTARKPKLDEHPALFALPAN